MNGVSGRDVARIATDPDVFEDFYRTYVESILQFVARRVSDPHLAADLTANVFLAAIESADRYRPSRGAPVAWLFGIARNTIAAERRRTARELRTASRIRGRELVDSGDLTVLHERLDAAMSKRALYEAMDGVSHAERAVLELVALDDLSVAEAAKALGIGRVAARVRLHRARRSLRRGLTSPPLDVKTLPEVP